jgi:hypothetical protein
LEWGTVHFQVSTRGIAKQWRFWLFLWLTSALASATDYFENSKTHHKLYCTLTWHTIKNETSLKQLYTLNGSPSHKSNDLNEKKGSRFIAEALFQIFIKCMCFISKYGLLIKINEWIKSVHNLLKLWSGSWASGQ